MAKRHRVDDVPVVCLAVLDSLVEQPGSSYFLAPVNVRALGLADYPRLVTQPMDLGTVRARLVRHGAAYAGRAFARDVRLTFRNAMLYNEPQDPVHVAAAQLARHFERLWSLWDADAGPAKQPPQVLHDRSRVEALVSLCECLCAGGTTLAQASARTAARWRVAPAHWEPRVLREEARDLLCVLDEHCEDADVAAWLAEEMGRVDSDGSDEQWFVHFLVAELVADSDASALQLALAHQDRRALGDCIAKSVSRRRAAAALVLDGLSSTSPWLEPLVRTLARHQRALLDDWTGRLCERGDSVTLARVCAWVPGVALAQHAGAAQHASVAALCYRTDIGGGGVLRRLLDRGLVADAQRLARELLALDASVLPALLRESSDSAVLTRFLMEEEQRRHHLPPARLVREVPRNALVVDAFLATVGPSWRARVDALLLLLELGVEARPLLVTLEAQVPNVGPAELLRAAFCLRATGSAAVRPLLDIMMGANAAVEQEMRRWELFWERV